MCEANAWTRLRAQRASRSCPSLSQCTSIHRPSQIAHTLKGITARRVFQSFPDVKKHATGGAFWSRSYYVIATGESSVKRKESLRQWHHHSFSGVRLPLPSTMKPFGKD